MTVPAKIVIGAGDQSYPGWRSYQESELNLLVPQMWEERFARQSLTAILAEHVWEHLDYAQGVVAAQLCWRYLRPGGYIRCAVPDGNFASRWYQEMVQIGGPGPADHPAANHRIVHTLRSLSSMFRRAGFHVEPLEWCDPWGHFHSRYWSGSDGYVYRTLPHDFRNQDGAVGFASLLVDAVKPLTCSFSV